MKKVKKILLSGIFFAAIGLWTYKGFAKPRLEYVYLDNEYIQTYRDRDGIWMEPSREKKSIPEIVQSLGSSEADFLAINDVKNLKKPLKGQMYFFPFGEEFIQNLEKEGKGRQAILSSKDKMLWPVILDNPSKITSRIGRRWNTFHTGIDIACKRGSIIVAAADGEVVESSWMGHYGKVVRIFHPELSSTETLYAHNSRLLVKKGEKVRKGQIIAYSGTTGRSTGPHLHFEVRYQNIFLNPEHFLPELPENLDAVANLD